MREIEKIIIYTKEDTNEREGCIFYTDGTAGLLSYDNALEAIKEVAEKRGMTINDIKAAMNKDTFYTMTEKEYKETLREFLSRDTTVLADEVLNDIEEDEEVVYDEDFEDYEEDNDNYYYEAANIEDQVNEDYEEEDEEENVGPSKKLSAGCLGVTVLAIGTAIVLTAVGVTTCSRKSKTGVMTESSLPTNTIQTTTTDSYDGTNPMNNDVYNDYTFAHLLDVTTNEAQKTSMVNVSSALNGFNGSFADAYVESGSDIRAALSFDEVVALQQAYNSYSIDDIRAIFNGYEIDAVYMSNAYKSASLQLMGAYVIENKDHPVDMSILLNTQEGRDFYNRYHSMFLAAKEATGEERVRLVNEFYKAVRADFPITEEVRTSGISHADDHNSLKDYQLAVTPMIAASEMIFQNLKLDYTLDDMEIDFFNDIGLCNHADDKFERLETIMLGAYEDNTNPLYVQFRSAIERELIASNKYVIDDKHRELSLLRRFKEVVSRDTTNTDTTTYEGRYGTPYRTWTTTETKYRTVTTTETGEMPEDEKKKIDDQLNKDNEEARKNGEEEAEATRKRIQDEEDKKAKEVEKDVEEENKKTQEDIDNANKQIDENNKDQDESNDKPVNESDIHNADIDDEHSNSNGDVDKSVKNITPDGKGANEPLPDPEDTGKEFDKKAPTTAPATPTPTPKSATPTPKPASSNSNNGKAVSTDDDKGEGYYEDEPEYDADGNPIKGKQKQKTR